jgi:hypothetical protein
MNQSDQLDLLALLSEQTSVAEVGLSAIQDLVNPAIDANPNDNLLMDVLGYVGDAQEALAGLRDLLQTMEQRDLQEIP